MNKNIIANFKEKINNNDAVFGIFMKTGDPAFVEVAGWSGMDFVILDMEHGPINVQSLQNNIRAAQVANVLPVVRVTGVTEEAIGRVLDIGAAAIEIPQITNAEQARKAINIAKFHPQGERGVCRFVRAAKYSITDREDYFKSANDTIVIVQIEGKEGMNNIEEILSVEGIDILFLGPYDISQSLGLTGQTTHPKVIQAMKRIVKIAKEKGVVIGTFTDTSETMKMWIDTGVQYISYSVDVGIFANSCVTLVNEFRDNMFK